MSTNTDKKNVNTSKKKKNQKKKLIRQSILIAIWAVFLSAVVYIGYLFFNPLQLKSTNIVIPYKSHYNLQDNIRFVFLGSRKDVTITGDLNTSKIGDYSITYKYKNDKIICSVKVADTAAPQLLLKNYTADLKQEITPDMLVYSVEDDSDVTVSFEENTNLTGAGKHMVTVVAEDSYGNVSKARTIVTRVADKTKPVITGNDHVYSLWQGTEAIADPKVTLSDNLDPNPKLSVDTSQVDLSTPGDYVITYTGTDRSGNSVTATQKVEVKENPEYGKKIVYLTFEGGPSQHTAEILSILEANDAKATFFVSGFNPDFNSWITEAADLGNTIGLGSYSYDDDKIYASSSAFWKDLKQTEKMVQELTGEDSKIIRFLGGSANSSADASKPGLMEELVEEVNSKGYQYYDWTVDSMDYTGNNLPAAAIVENSTGDEGQYVTIRLHDSAGKQTTVDALQKIIEYYKEKGYEFLPLSERSLAIHQSR